MFDSFVMGEEPLRRGIVHCLCSLCDVAGNIIGFGFTGETVRDEYAIKTILQDGIGNLRCIRRIIGEYPVRRSYCDAMSSQIERKCVFPNAAPRSVIPHCNYKYLAKRRSRENRIGPHIGEPGRSATGDECYECNSAECNGAECSAAMFCHGNGLVMG